MIANQNSLSTAEYRSLFTAAEERSPQHGFTIYLLGHTGMRRGEAAQFVPDWFDPAAQVIGLDPERSKFPSSSPWRTRSIPLSTDATSRIAQYVTTLSAEAFSILPCVLRRINAVAKAVGLDFVSPHHLRLTFAKRLEEREVPQEVIEAILGYIVNTRFSCSSIEDIDFDQFVPLYGDLGYGSGTDQTGGEEHSGD